MLDPYQLDRVVSPGTHRVERIARSVSEATRVPLSDILSGSRARRTARARQVIMWQAHREGVSSPQIGAYLNRDHTSVLNGIKRVNQLLKELS